MNRPNVALALTLSQEWRDRYQARLRALCPDADAEAMDSDNSPAMQGRMFGQSPEQCAESAAEEIQASKHL